MIGGTSKDIVTLLPTAVPLNVEVWFHLTAKSPSVVFIAPFTVTMSPTTPRVGVIEIQGVMAITFGMFMDVTREDNVVMIRSIAILLNIFLFMFILLV